MLSGIDELAIFGGAPLFERTIPVGQMYFPDWESYVGAMRGIFDREYYTNHGPLTRQFEERLADYLGVRHALCVTNATIGLVVVATALGLEGKVVVPSFTFIATAQALTWAGVEPVFCDVDVQTGHMSAELVSPLIKSGVSGILGVNVWGGTCRPSELEALALDHEIPLFFDSAQAFGCLLDGKRIGGHGSAEVFSFHATKILNCAEGGCIATNDDQLAARMRNIRSSYGAGEPVNVPVTTNGRFSEAQAALGLLGLERIDEHREHNASMWRQYAAGLGTVRGLEVLHPPSVDDSNWQTFTCVVRSPQFGMDRDLLLRILKEENVNARRYFFPGCHRSAPYSDSMPQYLDALPNTDLLCDTVLQLPIGALVERDEIEKIIALIDLLQRKSGQVAQRLGGRRS